MTRWARQAQEIWEPLNGDRLATAHEPKKCDATAPATYLRPKVPPQGFPPGPPRSQGTCGGGGGSAAALAKRRGIARHLLPLAIPGAPPPAHGFRGAAFGPATPPQLPPPVFPAAGGHPGRSGVRNNFVGNHVGHRIQKAKFRGPSGQQSPFDDAEMNGARGVGAGAVAAPPRRPRRTFIQATFDHWDAAERKGKTPSLDK
ncbi:hypothetical protein GE061_017335 [Apolygus lucorum]|uniref:Uncharacterized protein n=1 Tax=Apolygus lucorum TaxID=248454 RepID=A0A8S9XAL2_APOLU|nr:hypothetical protein GE061_017335 [Apolygus lucorum]